MSSAMDMKNKCVVVYVGTRKLMVMLGHGES